MTTVLRTVALSTFLFLGATATAAFAMPAAEISGGAVQGIGTASGIANTGTADGPTRLPRRDTKTPLVCSAADAAPKLADRVGEGSCRSHTEEHQAEHKPDQKPKTTFPKVDGDVFPKTQPGDINAITGR